ncbi:hypothetical protein NQZ68_029202 [Dissostichus eleginoides]|nr:hypothetical protein NQZ68_029202 [Dissostichus eleginoides]
MSLRHAESPDSTVVYCRLTKGREVKSVTPGNGATTPQRENEKNPEKKVSGEPAKGSNRHKWCTSWCRGEYLGFCRTPGSEEEQFVSDEDE